MIADVLSSDREQLIVSKIITKLSPKPTVFLGNIILSLYLVSCPKQTHRKNNWSVACLLLLLHLRWNLNIIHGRDWNCDIHVPVTIKSNTCRNWIEQKPMVADVLSTCKEQLIVSKKMLPNFPRILHSWIVLSLSLYSVFYQKIKPLLEQLVNSMLANSLAGTHFTDTLFEAITVSLNYIWKWRLQSIGHFVQGIMC